MTGRRWVGALAVAVAGAAMAGVHDAHAFCGFYVSGSGAPLANNAPSRPHADGTRTVLAMQNSYQGPPQDFAMVVPVPVVLQKENVKTLDRDVFERVDRLTAPRLVEYWEQDPCPKPMPMMDLAAEKGRGGTAGAAMAPMARAAPPPVKIEAQFTVGEYDIVVLSATDSTALDAWLRQNRLQESLRGPSRTCGRTCRWGMKFFVAKVDVSKVKFERLGKRPRAEPCSLRSRFHYDSDAFGLPIRLGLINSSGTQDLVVTILAPSPAYEAPTTTTWPSRRTSTCPTRRVTNSRPSTRSCSTRQSGATLDRSSRNTRGRQARAIPAPPRRWSSRT